MRLTKIFSLIATVLVFLLTTVTVRGSNTYRYGHMEEGRNNDGQFSSQDGINVNYCSYFARLTAEGFIKHVNATNLAQTNNKCDGHESNYS